MTASRDPDRLLRAFLAEGDERLSDSIYDVVRGEIEQQRQRVVIGPWRLPEMTKFVTIGLAAAAVLVVVLIGSQLFGPPTNVGVGPDASPTPQPAATPTPASTLTVEPSPVTTLPSWYTTSERPTGAGVLPAGSHESETFNPGFTYSVPEGWVNATDSGSYFELFQDTPGNQESFTSSGSLAQSIVMGVHPTPWFTCELLENNRGATAAEMVAAASANEALAVSDRGDVSLGGLTGTQIDVQRNPEWTGTCPGDSNLPAGLDPEDERTRAILLDVPDRGVLVILVYSSSSAEYDDFLSEALPVIESFEFSQ
jgi:hypothetical protein